MNFFLSVNVFFFMGNFKCKNFQYKMWIGHMKRRGNENSHSHLWIMTMLSVAYSHSSPTLSLPPLSPPKIHGCLSSPTILTPVSTLKSSGFPPRLSINGNLNSHRNRFRANSVEPDGDVQITTQFTQGNDGISKDTSGSNPSTSFLSVLCPLLKLFSVSLYSSPFLVFEVLCLLF